MPVGRYQLSASLLDEARPRDWTRNHAQWGRWPVPERTDHSFPQRWRPVDHILLPLVTGSGSVRPNLARLDGRGRSCLATADRPRFGQPSL